LNKKEISTFLSSYLQLLKGKNKILFFSFYGSYKDEVGLSESQVSDIDLILLFDKLDQDSLKIIEDINRDVSIFLGQDYHVSSGYYYGAYKPTPVQGIINIFLHVNAHTAASLNERHIFYRWGISTFMSTSDRENFGLKEMLRPSNCDFVSLDAGTPSYHLNNLKNVNEGIEIPCRLPPDYVMTSVFIEHPSQLFEYCLFSVRISILNYLFTLGIDLIDLRRVELANIQVPDTVLKLLKDVDMLRKKCHKNIDEKWVITWASNSLKSLIILSKNA
jgi:hypothetical protein